jgi:hypothetical protein
MISMNPQTAGKETLYEQLMDLPQGLTGEIINGQLHTHPRPAWPHSLAASCLGADLEALFGRGRGDRGGWWIRGVDRIRISGWAGGTGPEPMRRLRIRIPTRSQDVFSDR